VEGQDEDERLKCYACGEVHENARLVTTIDGRTMGSYQQSWFLYNEAVWVLKTYRSKRTRTAYLDAIEAKRGQAARKALREEMLRVWEWKQEKKK
jgi:DNA-binding GntR family transcriptional regulator